MRVLCFLVFLFCVSCGATQDESDYQRALEKLELLDLEKTDCQKGQILGWSGDDWVCINLSYRDLEAPEEDFCHKNQVIAWTGSQWLCRDVKYPTDREKFDGLIAKKSVPYLKTILVERERITEDSKKITFRIAKKKSSYFTKEITKTYDISELEKDFLGNVILPIFGLYHNHTNKVTIEIDEPTSESVELIETSLDRSSSLNLMSTSLRIAGEAKKPSFDFILLESERNGALIMDIDGEIRWQFPITEKIAWTSVFNQNKLVVYYIDNLYQIGLDWTVTQRPTDSLKYTGITRHHQMAKGKYGYLLNAHGRRKTDGQYLNGSMLMELDNIGNVLKSWDLGDILREEMLKEGDDPDSFIFEGDDWFHMNSAIYTTEEDDALLVSSRENFLIKIDYKTGAIRWILGDKTKHWHQFPSLARYALKVTGDPPVGQHSISLINENPDRIMMFNNGKSSSNQPEGVPVGRSYETSRGMVYKIDEEAKTAKVTWEYDAGISSPSRSSVYRSDDGNFNLLMYTHGPNLQVINKEKELVFEVFFSKEQDEIGIWKAQILDDVFSL